MIKKRTKVLICIGVYLFCFIFVAVGAGVLYSNERDKKQCTEKIEAIVAENINTGSEGRSAGDDDSGDSYAPVFEYVYNDQKYRVKSNISSYPPAFDEGEEVAIYVDPDDPMHIYVPSYKAKLILGWVFFGVGAVLVIAATIAFYFIFWKKKADDNGEEFVEYNVYDNEKYDDRIY